ncbi:MAG: Gfo/Idh/MocA family oxidoreductase [Phycisphaerae bacterium]|nr:Gfo/Idh/MocA family oxidoreductase [Phycisphaerae bacterium]
MALKQSEKTCSRRELLASSGKAATGAAVLGAALSGCSMPGRKTTETRTASAAARRIGANDQIRLGLIGSGGQGTHDTNLCCQKDNVVCVALADVAEFRMDYTTKVLTETMARKGHAAVQIDRYGDYRKLLDRKDIDAVVIATPDHWHAKPFIAACQAGKHIYQEKPFSFTIDLGFAMLAAAEDNPTLVIQIGTQRRSQGHYAEAKKLIDNGLLGKVSHIRAFDCRNYIAGEDPFTPEATAARTVGQLDYATAKIDWDQFQEPCKHKVPFEPLRYTAWRWYWDYAGGLVTDVGVHVIDNVHWLMGEPVPKSAVANGSVYATKYWETPDVVNAVVDYGEFSLEFIGNFTNGFDGDGFILYGTKATMEVRGNDVKVWADSSRAKPQIHIPAAGIEHQHNWIDCLRAGAKPNAPVQLGVSSLLPSHLANLAYRRGKKITWDPATRTAS